MTKCFDSGCDQLRTWRGRYSCPFAKFDLRGFISGCSKGYWDRGVQSVVRGKARI